MLKVKEIKAMTNDDILSHIYYLGVRGSGDRGTKQDEETLRRLYRELEERGIVEDWETAYELITR